MKDIITNNIVDILTNLVSIRTDKTEIQAMEWIENYLAELVEQYNLNVIHQDIGNQ